MSGLRLRAAAVACGVLVVAASACTSNKTASVPTRGPGPIDISEAAVPPEFAGLTATLEDISELEKQAGDKSYLAATRLWALRKGKHLRATLQIGRFVPDARLEDEEFRLRVVGQIAQSGARKRVLGAGTVYAGTANEQAVYVWFEGTSLLVLSVAADFQQPRLLLRKALEVRP